MATSVVLALGMVAVFLFVARSAHARDVIRTHAKLLRVAGVVLCVAALAVPIGLIFAGFDYSGGPMVEIPVALIVIGILMVFLPGAAARMPQNIAALEEIARQDPPTERFGGVGEGIRALAYPSNHFLAFARIVVPCMVAFWSVPATAVLIIDVMDKQTRAAWHVWLLLGILGGLLVMLLAPATAATHWQRYVIDGRLPRLPLPDRGAFGYLWRLWVALAAFGAVEKAVLGATPYVTSATGIPQAPVTVAISLLFGVLGIMALAGFGLALPARAVGDKRMTIALSMAVTRCWGFRYPLGLGVVFAALAAAIWVLGLAPTDGKLVTAADYLLMGAWDLVFFLGLTAVMTYLARAYLAAGQAR